jgi:enamine deaminase RidA (YjgF/YER057c/UK114 family)
MNLAAIQGRPRANRSRDRVPKSFSAALPILFALTTPPAMAESNIRFLNPEGLFKPATFSQLAITRPGTTVYISGQTARDENSNIVGAGDVKKQMVKVLENLQVAVGAAGGSMRNVAKITTYVVGLKSDDRIWIGDMVKKHFPVPPAHTLVGISALAAPELLVEIEAIAVLD